MATTIERDVTKPESPLREPRVTPPANGNATTVPGGRRRIVFLALGVVLVLLIAGGVRKLIWSRTHESTDNAQAEAQVRQAEATARKAHADLDRLLPLAQQQIVSQQQLDAAQTAVAAADAQLAAAQA